MPLCMTSNRSIALLISVLAAFFLMLGLAGCVVQPITRPAPVVLSSEDKLVLVSLDTISTTLLPSNTLMLVPVGVLSDTALMIDASEMSTGTAMILPLATVTNPSTNTLVFVDAETLPESVGSIGDIIPTDPITIEPGSMAFISIDPSINMSSVASISEDVDIPMTIRANPTTEHAARSSDAICRGCRSPRPIPPFGGSGSGSPPWICCMLKLSCCPFR